MDFCALIVSFRLAPLQRSAERVGINPLIEWVKCLRSLICSL